MGVPPIPDTDGSVPSILAAAFFMAVYFGFQRLTQGRTRGGASSDSSGAAPLSPDAGWHTLVDELQETIRDVKAERDRDRDDAAAARQEMRQAMSEARCARDEARQTRQEMQAIKENAAKEADELHAYTLLLRDHIMAGKPPPPPDVPPSLAARFPGT